MYTDLTLSPRYERSVVGENGRSSGTAAPWDGGYADARPHRTGAREDSNTKKGRLEHEEGKTRTRREGSVAYSSGCSSAASTTTTGTAASSTTVSVVEPKTNRPTVPVVGAPTTTRS